MVTTIQRKATDIFRWPIISLLFKNPIALFVVRTVTMLLFLSALYFGFAHPLSSENPYTTAIFWSLFWPFFMIVSLILMGPAFCGICPHGVLGRWLTPKGANKTMPDWLKNRNIGLGILLIAYWVPLYLFPGLLKTPWVASLLFLVLTLLAAFIFLRYKEMSYCTYTCPIGAVTKAYGKIGMTKLTTYQSACSECKTFECASACQSGLQPYNFEKKNSMRDCTLCMDCAVACEAVSFSITKPGSALSGEIKDRHTSHTWVYILLFAVITITMRLHHGLGHSPLKESLPWYKAGNWIETILPIGIDWVGFVALVTALVLTFALVFGGFKIASKVVNIPFKEFLHRNSYALAPVMIIGSLSHIGTFFFVHYASDLGNAWFWLIGSPEIMAPLATMRDGWVHIFSLFGFVGAFWSLGLLYNRLGVYQVSLKQKVLAWISGSLIIWGYIFLLVLQMTARG